jgi:hypothetical protein
MANKNPQHLSPENYIRRKAKSLTVKKCLVNENWQDCRLANITIAREHASANVTYCVYLVDLGCLGVKNTMYGFNITPNDWNTIEEKLRIQHNAVEISYNLAHNIIMAGLDFAEELGFQPHKEYTSVTQFFLADDNDNIPIMEVECGGKFGKPLYVAHEWDPPATKQHILKHLTDRLGEDGFHYILGSPEMNYADDDNDDVDDDS